MRWLVNFVTVRVGEPRNIERYSCRRRVRGYSRRGQRSRRKGSRPRTAMGNASRWSAPTRRPSYPVAAQIDQMGLGSPLLLALVSWRESRIRTPTFSVTRRGASCDAVKLFELMLCERHVQATYSGVVRPKRLRALPPIAHHLPNSTSTCSSDIDVREMRRNNYHAR